ncbi:MAG: hypothetical protein WCO99_10550, partial [Planctomycetota bacterium]
MAAELLQHLSPGFGSGTVPAWPHGLAARKVPNAAGRTAISRVVLAALEQVRPAGEMRLSADSVIADAGIDAERFLDAVSRLEGHYEMRFHESWLAGMRCCGDVVECIATNMFDAADRAAAPAAA